MLAQWCSATCYILQLLYKTKCTKSRLSAVTSLFFYELVFTWKFGNRLETAFKRDLMNLLCIAKSSHAVNKVGILYAVEEFGRIFNVCGQACVLTRNKIYYEQRQESCLSERNVIKVGALATTFHYSSIPIITLYFCVYKRSHNNKLNDPSDPSILLVHTLRN